MTNGGAESGLTVTGACWLEAYAARPAPPSKTPAGIARGQQWGQYGAGGGPGAGIVYVLLGSGKWVTAGRGAAQVRAGRFRASPPSHLGTLWDRGLHGPAAPLFPQVAPGARAGGGGKLPRTVGPPRREEPQHRPKLELVRGPCFEAGDVPPASGRGQSRWPVTPRASRGGHCALQTQWMWTRPAD